MTRNSRRLQKAVQAIFNDYREKASCPGQVYQNAACGCDNALQMWRGPKGDKGDTGPQGPKGDNAGSFLVDAEFVVDPEGQEPGAYLKLVLIDVAQQEQVVYVDLSYLTDIYEGGNGISIVDMVVAARLGAGLTFDANGNIASAYQFCDGLDETSNVVKVRLDSSNRILGFASGTCGGLTATVGLAPSATGVNLVLTGAGGAVLSTIPLEGGTGITVQKNAQTGGFTWLADPAGLVSSQTGNQLSVSQTDNKLYVGGNTLEYTFGTGAFTLKDSSGATLSSVTVPSAVRMLEDMELRTDDGVYLHLTYLRDNGLHAYQDVSLDELLCNNVDTADDTSAAYSKAVPSGNWQTASINEIGGKTIAWNQLVRNGNFELAANWLLNRISLSVADNIATFTVTDVSYTFVSFYQNNRPGGVGHKILVSLEIKPLSANITRISTTMNNTSKVIYNPPTNSWTSIAQIVELTNAAFTVDNGVGGSLEVGDSFQARNVQAFDLTLMFGSTIANEIYAMEQATPGAGVAYFRQMFPASYYPYNAGELRSAGVMEVESDGENVMPPPAAGTTTVDGITAVSDGSGTVTISGTTSSSVSLRFDVSEFTIPISGGLGGSHQFFVNNSFASGVSSIGFYYNNIQIDSWNLASQYRTTRNYTVMGGRLCNNWRVNIYAADTTVDGTIAPVFINDTSSATARYNFKEYLHATLSIPAAVQALPGYGWSAGTAYNYVDYARKVYVQRVGSVDLGSLDYDVYQSSGFVFAYGRTVLPNVKIPVGNDGVANAICPKYITASYNTGIGRSTDKTIGIIFSISTLAGKLWLCDSAYTTAADLKAALQGAMLYYELATPIETDISSLLTDTTIEVEPGGSLTFENQHGDDFRLPVPNSETFIYEHPWVFEDCVKGAMQPAIDALNARIDDVSVELTLDAHCEDVITPATAEPFDDYILSGSINTLLLNEDGTISDLLHHNAIPDSSAARGSVTMELFNPSDTDGLSFELYAQQSSGSDSRNYYSNVDPEADAQKCATLADFLAAGEQGLPLTYADETSFSGVTPLAENETLYASVVSNGNNSYTFTFTVRTPEVKETQLILDLVSGENRTDLKPLLEHVGGKVDMVAVPSGDAVQLSFGYAGAGYIFGSRRSDFPTVGLFANSAEDICAQTNLMQPTSVGPGADTFTYYFETLPTHFAIPSISEVDATGTKVGTTSYASPMLDMETMRCTGEGTALADIPEAGLVYTEYDTSSRPFVPTGRTIRLRAIVGNAGIVFTLWQQEMVDKPVLCLEPSCDPCIDLSPVMDIVDDKFGDLSPVAMSGSFNDLTNTPTNHATTDTDQDITGTKTFVGQKKVAFKQSTASDKLGFTLFDRNGDEVGYFEYNPSSSGKVNNTPVMTLGNYATKAAERSYVGFRRYSSISGASGAYNLLTPLIVDARTPFNLTTTYTNFYLPLGVSDGTNMYTVGSNGVLDLSAMIPTGVAHLAGAETFTGSKTFGAGVYGNAVAMSAGAIDVSAGTVFTKTITANTTISFSNVPAAPATACVTLILTNGGAYTVTWPSSVKWSDGTAPDLTASGVDVLTFLTVNGGTTWYGTVNSLGAA